MVWATLGKVCAYPSINLYLASAPLGHACCSPGKCLAAADYDCDGNGGGDPPEDPFFFLGWVRLHLVGCGPAEVRDTVRAACESGAIREPELHRDTTHVLVGGRGVGGR